MTTGKDSPVHGPPYSVFLDRMLQAFYESGLLREYLILVGRVLRLRVEAGGDEGLAVSEEAPVEAEVFIPCG